MYSSFRTVEFSENSTRSMASVGTSAIMIRRNVLATLVSVSLNTKLISWGVTERISILGKRWFGMLALSMNTSSSCCCYVCGRQRETETERDRRGQESVAEASFNGFGWLVFFVSVARAESVCFGCIVKNGPLSSVRVSDESCRPLAIIFRRACLPELATASTLLSQVLVGSNKTYDYCLSLRLIDCVYVCVCASKGVLCYITFAYILLCCC